MVCIHVLHEVGCIEGSCGHFRRMHCQINAIYHLDEMIDYGVVNVVIILIRLSKHQFCRLTNFINPAHDMFKLTFYSL